MPGVMRCRAIAVTVLVAAALALLVLQPVGIIALNSWRDDLTGQWSLVNYLRIFTTPNLIEPCSIRWC